MSRALDEVRDAHESRYLTWWWEETGDRLWFEGMVPGDQGVVLAAAIDDLARRLPEAPRDDRGAELSPEDKRAQGRADALALLASAGPGDRDEMPPTTVVLHARLEDLASGEGSCSVENGPALHPETARRLACDARLQVVLEGKDGNAVGIGYTSRNTPRWLRRQVLHRDGHTCTFPGCEMKRFLTIHHIRFLSRRGPTDFSNLIAVCPFHHTLLHEYEWSVMLDRHCAPVWFRPSGRRYQPGLDPPENPVDCEPIRPPALAEAAGFSPLFRIIEMLGAPRAGPRKGGGAVMKGCRSASPHRRAPRCR